MQSENWNKVNEILKDILEIEPSKRQEFIENANLEEDIRTEVESLLSFEEEADLAFNLSAIEFSQDFIEENDEQNPLIGQQIGVYQIVRELGFGGMGAVYLATRIDGKFEQKVALKLLKREMNTAELRRRFQQEREILASLEHPNIARLLDAGTTVDKIPYIAMEYIEGMSIDKYCNSRDLDLDQRLDLFRKVCSAVDFAHRNLIVHRDLKPSNILVTKDGIPKLLDFGISKILTNEFKNEQLATVTRMGVMTPSYASPEQLQRKSVTTATDIYSLGIVLYELLSGHRPFHNDENDIGKIHKAVLENDPPLPSSLMETFASDLNEKRESKTLIQDFDIPASGDETVPLEDVTKRNVLQHTKPQAVQIKPQNLKGDLDNIILKALKKEPQRRYSSAENFAADIKRHQDGNPVTALPDTFSYRASKFIKRNRLGVGAMVLISLAIVIGLIATLWQARIAQAERAKAEKRFNDVRSLANSFLFEISPEIEKLSGSTKARKLLVQRALEYLNSLSKESTNDLELKRELASAYQKVGDLQGNPYNPNIGDIKGALDSYEKALKIRQELFENEPDNIKLKSDLALNLELIGDIHFNGGDYSQAVTIYDRAIELTEQTLKEKPEDFETRTKLARLLRTRGIIPFTEGDNKKAIEYYSLSQKMYEQLNKEKPDDHKVAQSYYSTFVSIGEAQGWDEEYEKGGNSIQKGLDLLKPLVSKYPNDQPLQRALKLAYLKRAESYMDLEKFQMSEDTYLKSLEIAKSSTEKDPDNAQAKRDYSIISKQMAEMLDSAGKSNESLKYLKLSSNIISELSDKDPNNSELLYDVANNQLSIGKTYLTLKNYDEALKNLKHAKEGFRKVLKINSENTYAVRSSSFTSEYIGEVYAGLSLKGNRNELLKKAIENLKDGVDGLKRLKDNNKLAKDDFEALDKMEAKLSKLEKQIN